jgi:plasmid stabilization system protein ParE
MATPCGAAPYAAVAYLRAADKYCRPLASHLRGGNQPAIHTRHRFSASRPTSLACI